jgi:hypothetical protein
MIILYGLGQWPYYALQCLNKAWASALPKCVPRSCGMAVPTPYQVRTLIPGVRVCAAHHGIAFNANW